MPPNITQLQYLLDLVYASDGYNDGDRIPNDLVNLLESEIKRLSQEVSQ